MDAIIEESSLSAGAVYGYFRSKDELILAAITTSLAGISTLLDPLFAHDPPLAPENLLREVVAVIDDFSAREGFDLKRIALLGWSEAQRNDVICETMRGFYAAVRDKLKHTAQMWKKTGLIAENADADDIAKAMLAFVLGFVAEAAIIGDVDAAALARGAVALGNAMPPEMEKS